MRGSIKRAPLTALALAVSIAGGTALAGNDSKDRASEATEHATQDVQHAADDVARATKQGAQYTESAAQDAWLDGKLETALLFNRHLNNFEIDTDVKNANAILTGQVESEIDKELAGQVAESIEGIASVSNELTVDPQNARAHERADLDDDGRSFAQQMEDATTTAMVKSKLLWNGSTSGLEIDVDTHNDVVTLSGDVDSAQEKALAGQVAETTEDVRSVENQLSVRADQG
jgi:osmotically-inducible protein OsmY